MDGWGVGRDGQTAGWMDGGGGRGETRKRETKDTARTPVLPSAERLLSAPRCPGTCKRLVQAHAGSSPKPRTPSAQGPLPGRGGAVLSAYLAGPEGAHSLVQGCPLLPWGWTGHSPGTPCQGN